VSCWGVPGITTNVAGETVTPVGRPAKETFTCPANPLMAVADTVQVWLPAVAREMVVGDALAEKSAVGVDTLKDT